MKCQFKDCEKTLKNLNGLAKHIKIHNISLKEYYDMFMKKEEDCICKECGSPTTFIDLRQGYRKYCHNPCPTNKELGKVWKDSIKKIHGVDNVSKLKYIKEKKKETFQKNYGSDNIFATEEFKRKNKKELKEKYGVEYASQVDFVKKKRQQTFNEKFNGHPMKCEEIKEKVKNVFIEKYGVDNPLKCEEVKNKMKNTCLDKYGVDHVSKCKEIKNKAKETNINKFIKNKLYTILNYLELELIGTYKSAHNRYTWKCLECNREFQQTWNAIQQGCLCPKCSYKVKNKSKLENELYRFINDLLLNEEIVKNSRSIIPPQELDIFIPNRKIAIEFNGLYWHSEEILEDKNYHLNKTKNCNEKGIQLIHIFEDEWLFKKDIVKNRLKQILDVNNVERIHGRDCIIKEIDSKIKSNFLEKYHIQGSDNSVIKLGAFYNNQLVSVMTFSHGNIAKGSKSEEDVWELNRFCSNYKYHIPGIAGKLLSYFKKNYQWKEIFSYADRRWSNGNLYYKLGFKLEHITKPNYWYIQGYDRIHRFNLRKKPDEPKDIPEWSLRSKEGYTRIWDCGNLKFIYKKQEVNNNVII